ncbi:TerB family tellurite resistance protein [Bacteroides sp. 224]|uniref:TerB family tellurite resistance protein n=1 Tax=Bacteroides sp. 224 TaxID=2302936 RepID=UPI0013D64C98|nr:TerB family tellurite resistance protein [Bacteroides sp. 224]NDV65000.1 TerB family tellurite resistance protein [Bacteroides sp. 224]
MKTLEELKQSILEDGVIDAQEAKQLKEVLYADGVIDKEEAEFIFELNDAVSGKENDPAWEELFVSVISDFLLNDETSPGEIDEEEARWLLQKIQGDGQLDKIEKALLDNLKKKAKKYPSILDL